MQIIGSNLKKIQAHRTPNLKRSSINTNIEFTDVIKEKLDIIKDSDVIRISLLFSVTYNEEENKEKLAEIIFDGDILFSANKEESKTLTKSWKKKQIPEDLRLPLINFIIKKYSTKALALEEELNLPFHIPFPQVRKNNSQQQ